MLYNIIKCAVCIYMDYFINLKKYIMYMHTYTFETLSMGRILSLGTK